MIYRSPQALDSGVKAAIKARGDDPSRAFSNFFRHRLLCRVFDDPDGRFLLKGGYGMLSRIIDARHTRDIDLASGEADIESALLDLERAASMEMDDFITFTLASAKPINVGLEHRSGAKVTFNVFLGQKRVQDIKLDLVVDSIPIEGFDVVTPIDRLEIPGVPTCDYRVYTVECALSDKLCGIFHRDDDHPSSRIKDLVDVVLYALNEQVDGSSLRGRIILEFELRKMTLPDRFDIPDIWRAEYAGKFSSMCPSSLTDRGFGRLDTAAALASRLYDPVLSGDAAYRLWNPVDLAWGSRRVETIGPSTAGIKRALADRRGRPAASDNTHRIGF